MGRALLELPVKSEAGNGNSPPRRSGTGLLVVLVDQTSVQRNQEPPPLGPLLAT